VEQKESHLAVSSNDFASGIFGNFATVDELKKELSNVHIWGDTIPMFGRPCHYISPFMTPQGIA